MSNYLIPVYIAYATCALALTGWLAHTLFRNGAVFLTDVFADQPELARAVNRLLVTGFYLLNLGYAFFLLRADEASDRTEAVEVLAAKLGLLLISLAVVHFVNMVVFWKLRQRRAVRHLPPPVAPQRLVAPPPGPRPPAPVGSTVAAGSTPPVAPVATAGPEARWAPQP